MAIKHPKYIDIHSHVNLQAFSQDKKEVIARAFENDTWVINVGTQYETSKKAVELANEYSEGVYAIVGLHPIHTSASFHDEQELGEGGKEFTSKGEILDEKNLEKYRELLKNPKVVGIGECGLDYYRCDEDSINKQKEAFIKQIELANEYNKPLMLHLRNKPGVHPAFGTPQEGNYPNAYADALDLLKKYSKVKGDVHFFAGSLEDAKGFLDFGFAFSFNGAITFPPKKDGTSCNFDEIIKYIPMDMIMSETDCPYLAPVPYRGKRNEPMYVREVVKKIADIKGLSEDEVAKAIIVNAKRVFGI